MELQCQFSNCERTYHLLEDLEKHLVGVHGVIRILNQPDYQAKSFQEKGSGKENVDYESMMKKVFKCFHCPKGEMFTHRSKHFMSLHMKIDHRYIFIQNQITKTKHFPETFSCLMCKGGKNFYDPQKDKVIEHIKTMHKN